MQWCNGLDFDDWYEQAELNGDDIYLHGKCDEWVLDHYQPGDIPVIWNEYDESVRRVCLVHCYIKRGNKYVDVRGETEDRADIEEGFDYWPDNNTYECKDLEEYKRMIRKICRYRSKKWQ